MFHKVNYFIQDFIKEHGVPKRVLDVGSRHINGTVKDCIREASLGMPEEIIGVDFMDGENVDIVLNGHDLDTVFEPGSFDLVTCTETLEHDDKFWLTVEQMRKMVKPGGWLLITVPGIHFFRHDWPSDYYRFTTSAMEVMLEGFEDVKVEMYSDPNDPDQQKPNDSVFGYGRKPLK